MFGLLDEIQRHPAQGDPLFEQLVGVPTAVTHELVSPPRLARRPGVAASLGRARLLGELRQPLRAFGLRHAIKGTPVD